ncbi:hypothetical protein, partial [Kingella denitrificans]
MPTGARQPPNWKPADVQNGYDSSSNYLSEIWMSTKVQAAFDALRPDAPQGFYRVIRAATML